MDGLVNGLVAALASLGRCGDGLSGPAADFAWDMGLLTGAAVCLAVALATLLVVQVGQWVFGEAPKP